MGIQILKATSTARVVALDSSEEKLAMATRYGADEVLLADDHAATAILDMTGRYGADAIFDFVGAQRTVD
ncbi:zinc-binding dehydrogenase, partial [Staphylococcus epidermidis]|uniref:zinc-binding dehydrogenase n=1 Tax=Staphylococcus epidermidis TaxID=1282 RepID=UPI0030BBD1DA